MGTVTRAVEGAVPDFAIAAVVTHQAAHIGVVVGHVATHAAVFYRAIVLAGDAAHFGGIGRAWLFPVGADIGAHPAVCYLAIVLAGDAAHQPGPAARNVSLHVEVIYSPARTYFCKQALIVLCGIFDFEADGVAITVELSQIKFRDAPILIADRSPWRIPHINIYIQIIVLITKRIGPVLIHRFIEVFDDVGQFGCRVNMDMIHQGFIRVSHMLRECFRLSVPDAPFVAVGPRHRNYCKKQQENGKNSIYNQVFHFCLSL